jgi:hypothetical protein
MHVICETAGYAATVAASLFPLYKQRLFCDFAVVVNGIEHACHRLVLHAMCPFFRLMLDTPMQEAGNQTCTLELPLEQAEQIGAVLEWCYRGVVTVVDADILNLLLLADRLQVRRACWRCASTLLGV